MAIRRVTGAVSPSELIFADANALGATYDGSGTTIERGETFTLPAGGTTAVSNGALRLEALKGDCTITNNGNSTLTNASGVDGTILMRSGASDFPAFVRNSSMGSMSTPAREDFTGDVSGTVSGTINSNATLPAGTVVQVVQDFYNDNSDISVTTSDTVIDTNFKVGITPKKTGNRIIIKVELGFGINNTYGLGVNIKRTGPSTLDIVKGTGDEAWSKSGPDHGAVNWVYINDTNPSSFYTQLFATTYDTAQNTTSEHIYQPHIRANGSVTVKLNRRYTDGSSPLWGGVSNITVMEVMV